MALWTVYLSLGLLVALNASVETRPVGGKPCSACETGWTAYGCRCFKFFKDPQYSWGGGEDTCLSYGGNLASVHSHAEYMFIQNLIRQTTHASTPVWIGGHNPVYTYWFWSDGTRMNYKIWSPGQPSYSKDEHCLEMNSVHGNWNDVKCNESKSFVCVK
ncbi:galactose-specific lectin nattectin-like [Megalobrama amblycephala]|uniref:galactose-specific lectin nattectin-like n=1 Tax=Megalobrama amblycephala TaxID=75352 RepID=UPI002014142F|nr:galactose-specific lectin nattectin-like [Megalobrama amblycephala]